MVRFTSSDDADNILSDRWPVEGRGAVWRDLLTPAAKAALLASGTVAGIAAAPGTAYAQGHVETTLNVNTASPTNLARGVDRSASAVGDLDGDGDLDLVVVGREGPANASATIYENDGAGNFNSVSLAGTGGVYDGGVTVGDFDGDGDLDIVLVGTDDSYASSAKLYENGGDEDGDLNDFSEVSTSLTGVENAAVASGDFDGDGDLDLVISGYYYYAGAQRVTKVYENDGSGNFTEIESLPGGTSYGSISVADFDGDGDLDIFLTGFDTSGGYGYNNYQRGRLFENTGNNQGDLDGNDFTVVQDESTTYLDGFHTSASATGDFDGDGDLDVVATGYTGGSPQSPSGSPKTAVIENTNNNGGSGTLDNTTLQEATTLGGGYSNGSVSVADFNGDGDPDVLITGADYSGFPGAEIYENDGDGNLTFTNGPVGLTNVELSSSSVGDIDGDGDLDLLVTGRNGSTTKTATVYENQSTSTLTITGTDGTGNDVGWRMLSFPSAIQLQDLEDDFNFNFQGISSGNVVHVWDAANQTWSPVTNDTDVIPPEDGIMIYLFDDADDTVSSTGLSITTPSVGTLTKDRTLSGLGTGRFVLVGNPYLKAYNLNALTLDANGFQQSVQVYDPATDSYQTLTQGTDNVAAMQGFVLERKTPGSGATSLTFPTSGLQSGEGTLIKSREAPSTEKATSMRAAALRLTVADESGATVQDRARVLFHDEAQAGWDAYEATQFSKPGDGPSASLTSPTERNGTLVKRTQASMPVPTDETTVPLSVASDGASGTATISLAEAPEGWTFEIEDTATGETTALGEGEHTFSLSDGDGAVSAPGEARFVLHATPAGVSSDAVVQSLAARADGSGALLTWEAAPKSGTDGFEVHRMIGAGTGMFEKVGFVKADGASSKAQAYRFHTDQLSPGTHRFRLKQVGADGSSPYTETVAVQVQIDGPYRLVPPAPNPSEGRAQVRLTVKESQSVTVAVYDILGRRVGMPFDQTLAARSERAIQVGEDLPSGTYLIRVKGEQFTATERLTIVK